MNLLMRRLMANIVAVTVAGAAWVLLRFNPATSGFYPRCPIFFWLHVYCPGCGGTRAMAALLHGRLGEAMHFNLPVAIFFPFATAFFALAYWRAMMGGQFRWPAPPESAIRLCLVLVGIFTVARNIAAL